ncbi:hypothetical protein DLJ53_04355 [Acuticoccus sediminis]|uniref:Uncharacterized protein n=1 Tax=Acuticoccus sediminis TaxID=2184697 RepID=A0A8B2NYD0_9HYPH|nr:hypothetical protein [Acuticoccus sediminis]RAI03720.1 hypothetical protein DLJ53_04355 [Acuticoccus sediminis]
MVRRALAVASVVLAALSAPAAGPAAADAPTIVAAIPVRTGDTWRFDVTVRHDDEGWDHYVKTFVVATEDGRTLGTRTIFHPHVNEQPFTRSLTGITIPDDVDEVKVYAVDSEHGPGPAIAIPVR